jgi:hypothetical protein
MLTGVITNQSLDFCRALETEHLSQALGGVPSDKAHAPALAIAALRSALEN